MSRRPGVAASLREAAKSWRISAVVLQSFSSGLPLGLIWISLPAWLKYRGVNIATIGLFSLAQAPWTFKFLWAPLLDRYRLPFLGRKRSWMLLFQILLAAGIGLLALQGKDPIVPVVAAVAVFIAFCSASQDIAIDGYAVEVLEKSELGVAVGGRVASYRIAMLVAGALTITLGQSLGWPIVFLGLAFLYAPLAGVVIASPEPVVPSGPPQTLKAAAIDPFLSLFRKPRALEIIAFILLYKLGDNMATALVRPFLIERCFTPADVGLATATIGLFCTIGGTLIGAALTRRVGIGRALWIFGALQALACLGYVAVERATAAAAGHACGGPLAAEAPLPAVRLLMYGATALETGCQGLATGALDVFLIRLTQKRFSATQYALFASVFALGRTLAGAPAGFLVDAIGWTPFFLTTVAASVPGLLMLSRFVPPGVREPDFDREEVHPQGPIRTSSLAAFGAAAAGIGIAGGALFTALLDAARAMRRSPDHRFDFSHALGALVSPSGAAGWMHLLGPVIFGILFGVAAAALLAARRGILPSRTRS